jgi:aspartyl-tRNA(Asn)/glutamyl-tRNA(Gln) amidotransferase subunit B
LPTLNENLVSFAVKVGLATNCEIRERSTFSRKNYFYPDLPKGYQISQYADPICHGGYVEIETDDGLKRIRLTRIHMEEDTGKSIHDLDIDTLLDLNRCGVPLIEIVSEPDIRSSREAASYMQQLRQTLVYLGVCDGNMEEGSLRCDANVSVRPIGQNSFGTKTEIKNLNSFRNVEKAIEYEISRQVEVLEGGSAVQHATMMWDAGAQRTRVMRLKEQAHDYRYFPEPDLVPVLVEQEQIERLRSTLPELGLAKKFRLMEQYGLPAYDAGILADDVEVAHWYEASCLALEATSPIGYKAVSNWILTELLRRMGERKVGIDAVGLTPAQLASLVDAVVAGTISNAVAKEVLPELFGTGMLAAQVIEAKGLRQVSDVDAIRGIVQEVLNANPDNVAKYQGGKTNLFGFFVGQALKASGGAANPNVVKEVMQEALDALQP